MAADGADDEAELAAALAMSQDRSSALGAEPAAAGHGYASKPQAVLSAAAAAAEALKGNSAASLTEAKTVEVLTALLDNLVKNPSEEKFRKVKLSNNKIKKALSSAGAEELLLAAGFEKSGELLEVPGSCLPADVQVRAQAALDALSTFGGCFLLSAQLRAEGDVRCVAALASGGVAFGAMDNAVRMLTTGTWTESPKVLLGHERRAGVDGVLAVIAGRDGSSDLISAGRDGKIIAWRDGAEVAQMKGHGEGTTATGSNLHVVSCLGHSADGRLLSGGWDKTVRVWNGSTQEAMLEGHEYPITAVVGLDNGDIASASGMTISIWRGKEIRKSLTVRTVVRSLCSCGGNLFASGDNDGFVRVWDAEAGQQVAERKLGTAYLLSLARSAETGELATGAANGLVTVLALEGTSLRLVETLQHCGDVYGLAFLATGDLAAACGDSTCVIWSRTVSRAAAAGVRQDFGSRAKALAVAQAAADSASDAPAPTAGGNYEFSFPVEFGSSKMQLCWNRGEDTHAVADRFIRENDLDPRHRGDVIAFVTQTLQQQQLAGGGAAGGAKEFNYPVEVADGRKLTISWNRGEDPQAVAANFARVNGGIHPNELPDIVNFIQQVSGGPAPPATVQQAPAVSPAVMQQAIQQVVDMGFDPNAAKAALEGSGWDVEAAINRLFG